MVEPISTNTTLSILKSSFYTIIKLRRFIPKMINLLSRPKLSIDIRRQNVVFIAQDNREHHLDYFCLLVDNNSNKEIYVNPRNIKINNESYQFIIQSDLNFLKLNPSNKHWKDCKNDLYKIYKDNWLDISENRFTFIIKPFEKKVFPMQLIKSGSHIITGVKKNSQLFFEKEKLSLSIEINRRVYEYGLNRKYVYERYINYLAFYRSIN